MIRFHHPSLIRSAFVSFLIVVAGFLFAAMPAGIAIAACGEDEQEVSIGFPGAEERDGTYCVPLNSQSGNIEDSPIFVILRGFLQFLSVGVGFAVVGGFIFGGFLRLTARGNSAQTQKSTEVLLHAGIALLLYIFMFAILNFLIPGGILV